MVLAIVLGAVAGAVGFLPLFGGLQLAKRATATSNLSHAAALLLSALVSLIVLGGALAACVIFARDLLLPFALAEAAALVVIAVVYTVKKMVRK